MPVSQFQVYLSTDTSAPTLSGATGSLVTVLNKILVSGYGTKPGVGWTQPFASAVSWSCYQQGTGSKCCLSVRDDAIVTAREARICGFDSMTSVNSGSNPFPTTAQGVSGQFLIARKSAYLDVTGSLTRSWAAYADSSSLYMFVQTGDVPASASVYTAWFFGDIYSVYNQTDLSKCMIIGRTTENSNIISAERMDALTGSITASLPGHFMAHTIGSSGTSIAVSKHGDTAKGGNLNTMAGLVTYPNSSNNAVYISPIYVCESATSIVRGTMRGFYHICHANTNFTDGQVFTGSSDADYNGRSFKIIKPTCNTGSYVIETSNTLDTNN